MKRTAALVGVLAAVALALSAGASVHTQRLIYRAFTAGGSVAVHVTGTAHGSCNGGAISTDRADAWRCFAGNFVYDPCFSSNKASGIVLCPVIVGRGSVTEIRLKQPLPRAFANRGKPSTAARPWGIQITSGLKCMAITGASNVVDHRRANYACAHSTALWGTPSRTHEPWTIYAAPLSATKLTRKTGIKVAWF